MTDSRIGFEGSIVMCLIVSDSRVAGSRVTDSRMTVLRLVDLRVVGSRGRG